MVQCWCRLSIGYEFDVGDEVDVDVENDGNVIVVVLLSRSSGRVE